MKAHDNEHTEDPKNYWQDCSICASVIEQAIEADAFPNK